MKPSGRNAKPIQAQGPKLNLRFCTSAKVWLRNSSMTRCFSATSSRMMATFQRRLGNHTASCWPGQQDDVTMLAPGFASLHCCLPASGANSGFLPRARHPSTFRKFRKPVRDQHVANQFVTPTTLKVLQPHWHAEASSCTCKANGAALGILSFANFPTCPNSCVRNMLRSLSVPQERVTGIVLSSTRPAVIVACEEKGGLSLQHGANARPNLGDKLCSTLISVDYISFRYHIYTHTPSSLTHSPWTLCSKSFMVLVKGGKDHNDNITQLAAKTIIPLAYLV